MKYLKVLESYKHHFLLNIVIANTLLFRGVLFLVHAFVPMIRIPRMWGWDNTHRKIWDWHWYMEECKKKNEKFFRTEIEDKPK